MIVEPAPATVRNMSPSTDPRTTVRAIWQTRPSRRQSGRKVAGVAAAIARRYDIDPVLVRVGFVVAACYGIGIVLYLAAWAALPADSADPPTGPGPLRDHPGSALHPVVLVAAIVAGYLALSRGNSDVIFAFAVAAGLLYLLHDSRGDRPEQMESPTGQAAPAEGSTAQGPVATASSAGESPHTAPPPRMSSVAPGAGPAPRARRRRSVLTPVTIAFALVGGLITAGVTIGHGNPGGPRLVMGVMLAVVALGLLVGAFRRRGRGLLVLALPLLVLCYLTTKIGPVRLSQSGELRLAPTSVAQLAPSYHRDFGRIELDLRRLNLAQPAARPAAPAPAGAPGQPAPTPAPVVGPVHTVIHLGAGDVTVALPTDADVTVRCRVGVGSAFCLDHGAGTGPSADIQINDLGWDHAPGGRRLDLDISVGAGAVSVTR
jgi:phage shock protein PspC (stress-responsive transcriptional regulator)